MTRHFVYLALFLAFPSLATAQKPPGEAIRKGMQRFVDEGQVSGLVAVVGDEDGIVAGEALGKRDLAADQPMDPDTIFRVMSLTKPITAVAVMVLVDEGKVRLDDLVEKHLPEFRGQKLYAGFEGDKPKLAPSPPSATRSGASTSGSSAGRSRSRHAAPGSSSAGP